VLVRSYFEILYIDLIEILVIQPCWRNGSAQDFYSILPDRALILRLWVRAPRGAKFLPCFFLTHLEQPQGDSESIGHVFIFISLSLVVGEGNLGNIGVALRTDSPRKAETRILNR
jgi:hypothetical protein